MRMIEKEHKRYVEAFMRNPIVIAQAKILINKVKNNSSETQIDKLRTWLESIDTNDRESVVVEVMKIMMKKSITDSDEEQVYKKVAARIAGYLIAAKGERTKEALVFSSMMIGGVLLIPAALKANLKQMENLPLGDFYPRITEERVRAYLPAIIFAAILSCAIIGISAILDKIDDAKANKLNEKFEDPEQSRNGIKPVESGNRRVKSIEPKKGKPKLVNVMPGVFSPKRDND